MKTKILLCLLLAVLLIPALSACGLGNEVTYYTVKFDSGIAEAELPDKLVAYGETVIEPVEPSADGYIFLGWYSEDTKWDFKKDKVTANVTLRAKFAQSTFTVTYVNGESSTALTVDNGSKLTEPQKPTLATHDFVGWFYGNDEWSFETGLVTGDMTLTAKWSPKPTFTVIFDANGGTPVSSQLIYRDMTVAAPSSTTMQNHNFDGWYLDDRKWDFATDTVTKNITLTAKWTPFPTYTVSFDSDGGSNVSPQYVIEGSTASMPLEVSKYGFKFEGWYIGDTPWDFSTPITGNITLTAKWNEHETLAVTFDIYSILEILPDYELSGQNVPLNGFAVEPLSPSISPALHGYQFLGWYIGDTPWDFSTPITESITLTARVAKTHRVTLSLGTDGDGTPFEETDYYLIEGERFTKPATPRYPVAGKENLYQFTGWYIRDGVEWDFNTPITEDVRIYAHWSAMLPPHEW